MTVSLAPDALCVENVLAGASLNHRPGPRGGWYGLPRVASNPSPRDHATIADPIARPMSSDRTRTPPDTPLAERPRASESASRASAAVVVGSPSRSSESSTVRSAVTAVSVGSTSRTFAARMVRGAPAKSSASEGAAVSAAASPAYSAAVAYAMTRDATGGESRSTRIVP